MGLIRFERYRPLEKKTVDAKEVRAQIKALSKERDRLKAEVERLKSERAAFISDAEVIASIRGQLSVVS